MYIALNNVDFQPFVFKALKSTNMDFLPLKTFQLFERKVTSMEGIVMVGSRHMIFTQILLVDVTKILTMYERFQGLNITRCKEKLVWFEY